jgi:hypothetical protein
MRPCGRCGQAVENNVALCPPCAELVAAPRAEDRKLCSSNLAWESQADLEDDDAGLTIGLFSASMFAVLVGPPLLGFLAAGTLGLIPGAILGIVLLMAAASITGGTF